MKKLFLSFLFFFCLVGLVYSYGSGTSNFTWLQSSDQAANQGRLEFVWVTNSGATGGATGVVPKFVVDSIKGSYLITVVTKPASTTTITGSGVILATTPSAYNLTVIDEYGADVLGGVGAGRSATLTEQVTPAVGALYGPRPISGNLTITITSGGSAGSGTAILYFYNKAKGF